MTRQLAYYVHLDDDKGEPHVFGPDDDVPAWAAKKITNRSAWADGEADTADPDPDADAANGGGGGSDNEPKPYAKWKKGDLEAEVAKRNDARDDADKIEVEGKGTVKDLAAALDADDAANED